MNNILNDVTDETLGESYKRINGSMMAQLMAVNDLKEMEQKLKDDVVQVNQFYKKDNTPDYAKVKMALLKKAIEIVENGAKNKLAEDLDILEQYIADIKAGRISPAAVNGYMRKLNMVSEAKINNKDTVANMKSQLNGDIVEALSIVSKNQVDSEKERIEAENNESKPPKKDKSIVFELVGEIKKKLKKVK